MEMHVFSHSSTMAEHTIHALEAFQIHGVQPIMSKEGATPTQLGDDVEEFQVWPHVAEMEFVVVIIFFYSHRQFSTVLARVFLSLK